MKFNETKFWNVYSKIALLSKSILCKNLYKMILYILCCIFSKDVFYNFEFEIIIMPNKFMSILNPE